MWERKVETARTADSTESTDLQGEESRSLLTAVTEKQVKERSSVFCCKVRFHILTVDFWFHTGHELYCEKVVCLFYLNLSPVQPNPQTKCGLSTPLRTACFYAQGTKRQKRLEAKKKKRLHHGLI